MQKKTYRYLHRSIPGWFLLVDFYLMGMVGDFQELAALQGPILEFRCYKVKSAILPGKLPGPDEELFLVELFEGIGTSGVMDTPLYGGLTQKTLERKLRLFQVDKTTLGINSHEIIESLSIRDFRIIYFNGGHTYEPVWKDLKSAIGIIHDTGVIILDHCRNISFPGMLLAFAEFLFNRNISVPFATETKTYLVKTELLETNRPLLEHRGSFGF